MIFGWIGTFMYCWLFADITSIVSTAITQKQKEIVERRNFLLSKLQNKDIPKEVFYSAENYLAYTEHVYHGLTQQEVLGELTTELK